MLREKALKVADELGIDNFTGSNGWITRFKDRHGMVYKKLAGESAAVNTETTEMWLEALPGVVAGYEPRDIFNADETGLFFNCLPDKTLTMKGESCHGGKAAKERISVLLCANADGSEKLQPIVIGKAIKPRCFKNVKTMPVKYHAKKKAWMTTNIFNVFLNTLDASMGTQRRRILLFLDNCAAHPQDTSYLKNIKVVFYPPNCTSVLQPLDMGVIKCFKHQYWKRLVQKALFMLDAGMCVDAKSIKVNVLQAIHYTVAAWKQVTQDTIKNCFTKCGYNRHEAEDNSEDDLAEIQELPEEEDQVFNADWLRLYPTQDVTFNEYVECDETVATCGVESIEDLCLNASHVGGAGSDSSYDETGNGQPETVPTFTEAVTAFEQVKSYLYAQKMEEREEDAIVTLDHALFASKRHAAKKQTSITDFFRR